MPKRVKRKSRRVKKTYKASGGRNVCKNVGKKRKSKGPPRRKRQSKKKRKSKRRKNKHYFPKSFHVNGGGIHWCTKCSLIFDSQRALNKHRCEVHDLKKWSAKDFFPGEKVNINVNEMYRYNRNSPLSRWKNVIIGYRDKNGIRVDSRNKSLPLDLRIMDFIKYNEIKWVKFHDKPRNNILKRLRRREITGHNWY